MVQPLLPFGGMLHCFPSGVCCTAPLHSHPWELAKVDFSPCAATALNSFFCAAASAHCLPLSSYRQGSCSRGRTGHLSHPVLTCKCCPQGPLEHLRKARQGVPGISKRVEDPSAQISAAEGKVSTCQKVFSPQERQGQCLDADGD